MMMGRLVSNKIGSLCRSKLRQKKVAQLVARFHNEDFFHIDQNKRIANQKYDQHVTSLIGIFHFALNC